MCTYNDDYCGETVEDLKDSIASQNKKICHLQKKLENYLEVVVERDSLQELCYGFDQWKNEIENHHKKIYCELNTALDLQKERFSKVLAAEREWENMVTELQYSHDCMCNQLKTHKSNEHRLQSQLAESEKSLECVQDELCRTKSELEKTEGELRNMTGQLKGARDDVARQRGELDELAGQRDELNATIAALRCALTKSEEERQSAGRAEKKWNAERAEMLDELQARCRKLEDAVARNEELARKLRDGECALKTLSESRKQVCEASERARRDAQDCVAELEAANRAKDDELCRARDRIAELQRDNERAAAETAALGDKARDCECQLNRLKFEMENGWRAAKGRRADGPRAAIDDDLVKAIIAKYSSPKPDAAYSGCVVKEMESIKCELENVMRETCKS